MAANIVVPPPGLDKSTLRTTLRRGRRLPGRASDPDRGHRVARALVDAPAVAERLASEGAIVAVYASLPHEPPTQDLRRELRDRRFTVWLPIALADGTMCWAVDSGRDATAWGVPSADARIPQPKPTVAPEELAHAAVLVIPALAATTDGRRLGQGGGYYDRLLERLPAAHEGGPLRVCLVGPEELLEDVPTDPHDQPVDLVITA